LRFVERSQGGEHIVDRHDRATVELSQGWTVRNRMGIRGAVGKDGTLLLDAHFAVEQDIVRMREGRRPTVPGDGEGVVFVVDHLRSPR
jgi:hypothetical protein